jgi:polyisoprenoid-binding protein YceI
MKTAVLALWCIASAAIAADPAPAAAPRNFAVLPEKSQVAYKIVHKFHEVDGKARAEGKARVLPDGTVQVQVLARVADFDSGNANRDAHMKEVTEAAKFPTVELKAVGTGFKLPEPGASAELPLKGQLTFHGVAAPIEVKVRVQALDATHFSAESKLSISLEAFKVERPSLLTVKVEDQAQIELRAQLEAR